jgi:hypothetical protein
MPLSAWIDPFRACITETDESPMQGQQQTVSSCFGIRTEVILDVVIAIVKVWLLRAFGKVF